MRRDICVAALCRFSNGSLQALPRSPFAGPMQEAALRHLYTGSTPAAVNSSLNPELLLGVGALTPAQQHARLAGKWGKTAADMYCGPGGSSLGTEAAQQPLPAAAAPGSISRINSADDSSADGHGNPHGEFSCVRLTSISIGSCPAPAVVHGTLP
jgi:hypothetical protein